METITLTEPFADSLTSRDQCPADRTLAVVGTRSAVLLMREALYGTRRFDQFARRVGISEAMAASRLRELVDDGLLVRVPYREPGHRTRHEYDLTEKGRDRAPGLVALLQSANRWAPPDGAPVELVHTGCGASVAAQVRCTEGHLVDVGDLELQPGAGLATS